VAAEARIDIALIDQKVLAFIDASDDKTIRFLDIARQVGCAPITVRRSVHRLKAAGKLSWEYTSDKTMRFCVNGDKRA
jgi:hypothetical protein